MPNEYRSKRGSGRELDKAAALFKVLSDPHRLTILATIARSPEEVCVCDLTADLPLEQPTVSHHLRVLKNAGLVVCERRGTWVYYRVAPGAVEHLRRSLEYVAPINPHFHKAS